MSQIELCWSVTSYVSIIVQLIAAGVCLGMFVQPYMQGRWKAVKAGAVYSVVMTVLYIMPPQIDNILAYFIGILAAFAGILKNCGYSYTIYFVLLCQSVRGTGTHPRY